MGMYHQQQNMYDVCKNHMHRYVLVQTADQQAYDGIVENVDDTNLYLAVPVGETMERNEGNDERLLGGVGLGYGAGLGFPGYGYPGFGYPGYGFPGYGFPGYGYPGYGYPFGPRRRFQRLILPLAAITALSLLPYY
jgi:small nuclear ribonucleoprotein (snRNP)-like protein